MLEENSEKIANERARSLVAMETVGLQVQIAEAKGYPRQIELLQIVNQHQQKEIQELKEKVNELTPSKSSNLIGKQGEALIHTMLETAMKEFPYSTVEDKTKEGHCADFHVCIVTEALQKVKILVDSKNYTRTINSDEVNKLYSDVDADVEAQGGLLVSIRSPICKAKQFHIGRTLKQKPVLFLSFQNIDDGVRQDMLCWALRTLSDISVGKTDNERIQMIERIEEFLNRLELQLKGLDKTIQMQNNVVKSLAEVYNNLLKEIMNFRNGGEEKKEETIELIEVETPRSGCDAIQKNGVRCGKRSIEGTTFCKIHTK
jgi:DNA-binding protein Fis